MSFEKKLKELEEITETMKDQDIPLEKSIEYFEKGINLAKELDKTLKSFEKRVDILLDDQLEEFK